MLRNPLVRFALFSMLVASCSAVVEHRIIGLETDCVGAANGTPCAGGDYCFADQCRFSFCGDGFKNASRGEECDDGNLLAGDGCEPTTCVWTCDGDTACPDDGNVCNGPESCNASAHQCSSGPASSPGTTCTVSSMSGMCSTGLCVPPGCGDGSVNPATEECEPPAQGCMVNCVWQCEGAGECPAADPCTNARHCDLASHMCADDGPLSCDDSDPCTADSCSAGLGGCNHAPIDADMDGYAPRPLQCSPSSATQTNDCDDGDPFQNPLAVEVLNGEDDNCNDQIDEGAVSQIVCYRDEDHDMWGDQAQPSAPAETCPAGYVPERVGGFDCSDDAPNVNPGILADEYFDFPYCDTGKPATLRSEEYVCDGGETPDWDYDCDHLDEPWDTRAYKSCETECGVEGWLGTDVPACGQTAARITCSFSDGFCESLLGLGVRQRCR